MSAGFRVSASISNERFDLNLHAHVEAFVVAVKTEGFFDRGEFDMAPVDFIAQHTRHSSRFIVLPLSRLLIPC